MEYVVQLSDLATPELEALLENYRDFAAGGPGEVRSKERAEVEGVAKDLADLRDRLNSSAPIQFHICRHDEGDGDCSASVVIL